MTTFYEALESEQKQAKTLTENGAIAYQTAGKEILDFNFAITQMRQMKEKQIQDMYAKVYFENPLIAIKYLFYVGDIREGLGERKIFKSCMNWLCVHKSKIATWIVELIPEYSRWDILVQLIEHKEVETRVTRIIEEQLNKDLDAKNKKESVSLLAKWLPSENASSPKTVSLAKHVRKNLGLTPKVYRKILSSLRAYLNVVEIKMSDKRWSDIEYETVPSMANLKYKEAFERNDYDRRTAYLNSLAKGKTKINATVSTPCDIVANYSHVTWDIRPGHYNETLEQMWKSLPNKLVNNVLVIRDGSGSMAAAGYGASMPLVVSTAMAIYMAQHNTGGWKNKFITFSNKPKVISIDNCESLRDCLEICAANTDWSNTDIYKTMMLVLKTAKKQKMSQQDMPKTVLIISDMQFDGRGFNFNKTLFENISDEFKQAGYLLPRICFWNVAANTRNTIPMQQNELGLCLISGYSVTLVNMVMSGELDPYKALLEQLNSERYKPVEEAYKAAMDR